MYFFELINSELFPHQQHRHLPVIQAIEETAYNYFWEKHTAILSPEFSLVEVRQLFFGLLATSADKDLVLPHFNDIIVLHRSDILKSIFELKRKTRELNAFAPFKNSRKKFSAFEISLIWDILQLNFKKYFASYKDKFEELKKQYKDDPEKLNGTRIGNIDPKLLIVQQKNFLKPAAIKLLIDEYYVGPESIKETLSRIFYEHHRRLLKTSGKSLPKRNVLLIGPSGSGKSYLIKKLADIIQLPFVMVDCTKLTQSGYIGLKIDDILIELSKKNQNGRTFEGGIIFLDELDKLANGAFTTSNSTVSTTGAQQDILKLLEPGEISYNASGRGSDSEYIKISADNLLIIGGGAFTGIEKLIMQRKKINTIGFRTEIPKVPALHQEITLTELVEYGLLRELAARFQIITVMPQKTVDDLVTILIDVKDSILKSYRDYCRLHGCHLDFTHDAVRVIAEHAISQDIGARGLVKVIEAILPMYQISNRELRSLTVTKEYILEKLH